MGYSTTMNNLTPHRRCQQCGAIQSYKSPTGDIFESSAAHTLDECAAKMNKVMRHQKGEIMRLTNELHHERFRQKGLIKIPTLQKDKLLDQCRRWRVLYERELHRHALLKKEIVHAYGTLDYLAETTVMDEPVKAMASYITNKLQKLIKESVK